jgi:hypothetical protein
MIVGEVVKVKSQNIVAETDRKLCGKGPFFTTFK